MSDALAKTIDEIEQMNDDDYLNWVCAVADDAEENSDRKGPVKYIVEDTLAAGESIGRKINEAVDEYRGWRQAEREAQRAEQRAAEMEERVRRRRAGLRG